MRLATLFAVIGIALCGHGTEFRPLLVLHLDFNTIQMKKQTVIDCLRAGASAGYNAVLWEVEDKIRWDTCPECVHAEAFTKDEFREILAEARQLHLEPIPLLQTVGHAEYVLVRGKHDDWMEDPSFPACYCVSKEEVRSFLRNFISEYLDLFGPEVRHFHLGGDEARSFGTCKICSRRNRMELYAEHLGYVAEPLVKKGVKPGIWCDMVLGNVKAFLGSGLPSSFTIWHWDYVYDGRNPGNCRDWTKHIDVLGKRGHDVIFTTSSSSTGDGPFLPRYGAHMVNVAASAALARREKMLGFCMSSWSVRKFPKILQYPIWDFAARRFLRPSKCVEEDECQAYERYFGRVDPWAMRRLTEWNQSFIAMDATGWKPYIKDATPAPMGTFDRTVSDEVRRNPHHCKEQLDETRRISMLMRSTLASVGLQMTNTSASVTLKTGVSLAMRFADAIHDAYKEEFVPPYPVDETTAYYLIEQTPLSATNCADVVWSVLKSKRKPEEERE